jgi:hypothetical protein
MSYQFDDVFYQFLEEDADRREKANYKRLFEQFGGSLDVTKPPAPFTGGNTGVAMPERGELAVGAPMDVGQANFNPNSAPPVQVGGVGGYMGRDDRWKSIMNFPVYPWQRG